MGMDPQVWVFIFIFGPVWPKCSTRALRSIFIFWQEFLKLNCFFACSYSLSLYWMHYETQKYIAGGCEMVILMGEALLQIHPVLPSGLGHL